MGRLAGKLVNKWKKIVLQYEPQPSTTDVGQAVSESGAEEPDAALMQAAESECELGSSEDQVEADCSGALTLASGIGENSISTECSVDTSVSGSGANPPATDPGTLSYPESRTKARAGKRIKKCKDPDCEKCQIEINCGNCESCRRPEMKLKCVERLVLFRKMSKENNFFSCCISGGVPG